MHYGIKTWGTADGRTVSRIDIKTYETEQEALDVIEERRLIGDNAQMEVIELEE